jgi:hypothetical protein
MAKISTYPADTTVSIKDMLIGTDDGNNNATKNYKIGDILSLGGFTTGTGTALSMAMWSGATSLADASPVSMTQSSGGIDELTIGIDDSQLVTFEAQVGLQSKLKDQSNLSGTLGQVLSSTVDGTEWISPTSLVQDVFQNLVAQGTSDATTSVMGYGVNVFTTATVTDYSTKLPQPTTGMSTKVINMSSQAISIYPSNVGGQINNLTIDAPLVIPNNGIAVTFICTVNPLPGGWNTLTNPAVGQLEYAEIEVSHTNGVVSNGVGYSTATLTSSVGIGVDGNGNILLTGNWLSENSPTTLLKMKTYTNILQSDLASIYLPDAIHSGLITGYLDAVNSSVQGNKIDSLYSGGFYYDGQFSGVGTLSAPAEVGDTNTLYFDNSVPFPFNGVSNQIGSGGAFSSYYYTFNFYIPASAATKVYKFKIFLEYL